MAKIKVMGDAVVITSSLKTADIMRLIKFNEKALTVREKESKDPIFRVNLSDVARFSVQGINYNGTNEGGYAIATLAVPVGMNKEAKQAYLSDNFAPALHALNAAEKEIAATHAALKKDIETAEKDIVFVEEN